MMRDLIRQIAEGEPDIEIVGEANSAAEFDTAEILATRPGLVIMQMEQDSLPVAGKALLDDLRRPQILGLRTGGGSGYLYRLLASTTVVEELSAATLRQIIRRQSA